MANQAQQEYLNDLIHEAAFEAIKQSEYWCTLATNADIDAKADELAEVIKKSVSEWFGERAKSDAEIELECKAISKHYDYMDDQILECVR